MAGASEGAMSAIIFFNWTAADDRPIIFLSNGFNNYLPLIVQRICFILLRKLLYFHIKSICFYCHRLFGFLRALVCLRLLKKKLKQFLKVGLNLDQLSIILTNRIYHVLVNRILY